MLVGLVALVAVPMPDELLVSFTVVVNPVREIIPIDSSRVGVHAFRIGRTGILGEDVDGVLIEFKI